MRMKRNRKLKHIFQITVDSVFERWTVDVVDAGLPIIFVIHFIYAR